MKSPGDIILEVKNLTISFGGESRAVEDVSFNLRRGELLTLLGPSGSGKSTILRCIAGLEKPGIGIISLEDQILCSRKDGIFVPPHKRGVGMVFQSYALWPHMRIRENVAYGLSHGRKKVNKEEALSKVRKVLDMVGLKGFEDRYPSQLSGGEQQRVALARSLVYEPKLLLLDEPLSNLDAKLRSSARLWLKQLQGELGLSMIYVTHDQAEALSMSDRILVLNQGRIVEEGIPTEIYEKPRTEFVAAFVGASNILESRIEEVIKNKGSESQSVILSIEQLNMDKLLITTDKSLKEKQKVLISIKPERIHLYVDSYPEKCTNVLRGRILSKEYSGNYCQYVVEVGKVQLRVIAMMDIDAGKEVFLELPSEEFNVLC